MRRELRICSRLVSTAPPIHFAQALRRRLGELALAAPRVPAIVDERPWQPGKEPAHHLAEESIYPGPGEDPAPDCRAQSLFDRHQMRATKLSAPHQQLVVQIHLDRADVAARAAQRGSERQTRMRRWIEMGRQHRADWPGHGHAVAMPPAAPIDGAGVHAGAAANAVQRSTVLLSL